MYEFFKNGVLILAIFGQILLLGKQHSELNFLNSIISFSSFLNYFFSMLIE